MDVILPVLLVLSLILNGGQAIDNIKDERVISEQDEKIIQLEVDVEKYKEANDRNLNAFIEAANQNDKYNDIVSDLEVRLEGCNKDLREQLDKINNWRDSDRLKKAAIEDLRKRLDSESSIRQCRVPEWVDFEASGD